MKILSLIQHWKALRSAPLRAVARRAATLAPDYLLGDGSTRALVNITLEITYRCNVRCEFCFLKDSVLGQKRQELSLDEITDLADQARPYGASFFITGGEPFLRRDLPQVVEAIKKRGLKVGINTNGLLVDAEKGREVREAGLDYVIFSLHGPQEVHDRLERHAGAFERVLENLETFVANKGATRVITNCVVAKQNADCLAEVPDLLAHLPVDAMTFQHETFLTATEVARHKEVWTMLFPDRPLPMVFQSSGYGTRDFDALDREITELQSGDRAHRWHFPVFFKPLLKGEELQSWYHSDMEVQGRCLYIWTDTRVEPDGVVNACQVMPTPMGNVRDTPLREILNGKLYREFRAGNRKAGGVFPACARCCKLYRNPMNFAAREPKWKTALPVVESPQP